MSLTDAAFKEAIARDFKYALRRIPYLDTVTRGRSAREFGTTPGWASQDGCLPSNLGSLERSEERMMSCYYPTRRGQNRADFRRQVLPGLRQRQPSETTCSFDLPQRTLTSTKSATSLPVDKCSGVLQRSASSLLGGQTTSKTGSHARASSTQQSDVKSCLDDDCVSVVRSVTSSCLDYPAGVSEVYP
ncbi:hypothetical protein FOL47_002699 [Perkinsus chesapeaki]|uniref:Uncharacterized protein n=1 Tax=Perkinsus chesapeaki TaxID=330153 RepID=A0A7J6MCN3_PERCH|nr:hypothetical protein FOL47_002699 [Perkinsus chesapeaki]